MSEILLRISLPDDYPDVTNYGVTQMASDALDYLSGWLIVDSVSYDVVGATGPDSPSMCWSCGCAFHMGACTECDHPLCAEDRAS